jgi:hypothetical protein
VLPAVVRRSSSWWTALGSMRHALAMSDPTPTADAEATSTDLEPAASSGPRPAARKPGPPPEGAGVGLGIALIATSFLLGLGFLLALTGFAFLATYAVVKAITDQGPGNPVTVALGFVLIVGLFVTLLAVGMGLLGRSLSPRRRRRGRASP